MTENLVKKGYFCDCECKVHQIKKLGLELNDIYDLNENERKGVVKRISVAEKRVEEKFIKSIIEKEKISEQYICQYELYGKIDEYIVILKKSDKTIQINNLTSELDIKSILGEDETTNDYRKEIIITGVKSLFDLGEISY